MEVAEEEAMQGNGFTTNGAASGVLLENNSLAGPLIVSPPLAIAPGSSFLEKIQGIPIENSSSFLEKKLGISINNTDGNATANATNAMVPLPTPTRRVNTFNSKAPPPILKVMHPLPQMMPPSNI